MVGTGWTTVVVSKIGDRSADAAAGAVAGASSASCRRSTATGAPAGCSPGTAFSAVLTDDGRIAVGAVRPEKLYEALAR